MTMRPLIEAVDQGFRKVKTLSLEFLLALSVVFVTSGGVRVFYIDQSAEQLSDLKEWGEKSVAMVKKGEGSLMHMALLLPIYVLVMIYLIGRWKSLMPVLKRGLPFVAVAILAIASTFWSLDERATFLRSGKLFLGTMTGFYFAMRYSPPEFCNLMGRCFLWLCVLQLVMIAVDPFHAIHMGKHFPAIKGTFGHKNMLGNVMIISLIFAFFLMKTHRHTMWVKVLFFLSLLLVALSLSRSAWVTAAFCYTVYLALWLWRVYKHRGALLLIMIFLSFSLSTFFLLSDAELIDYMLVSMGRDATLSGRTEIWSRLFSILINGPFWFGFGYEAFWTSYQGAISYFLRGGSHYLPPHAHNGWLHIMTHLGLVGAILVTIPLITGLVKNFKLAIHASDLRYSAGLVFLLMYVVINIVESHFMGPERLHWIIFIYYAANCYGKEILLNKIAQGRYSSTKNKQSASKTMPAC